VAIISSLFSVCPRVSKARGRLVARTAWQVRLATLGCLYREVVVDLKRDEVTVRRRYLWAFSRRRRVRFGAIAAVTYGYQDWGTSSSWSWAYDSNDLYVAGLRLRDGEDLRLFYFFGDGTFTNDGLLPDWVYWEEYLLDVSGTQDRESRVFVDLLAKMIGVPVVPARF
jgi:hypothetical protein